MIEKINPAHLDKIADRIAGALVDYNEIVDEARHYIGHLGGFEKRAEWGLF